MTIRKFQNSLIAAALAALACTAPPPAKSPAVPVELAPASSISAALTIDANGVVEPLQTVSVVPQVGGTLDSVFFREGDDVQTGQPLFRLDPRPFDAALRQAEAALARDQAQSQSAQRDAERYKTLAEKDYVTKSQADQAVSAAAAMDATVQSDRAAVDNAKLNLAYTTIKSPISGRTGRLLVRRGNVVRPNADELIVINQLRPILVRFPVIQHDFPSLQRRYAHGNVPVRVVTADSGKVGEVGSLGFLDNAVDSLTGTVTAKAKFENESNVLWPGEYVRVSVQLSVDENAVAVPTRALVAGQQGNYVFVVGDDKVAKVRQVSPGRVVGDLTTIEQGIKPGERVVVDGQSRLTPNAHVDIKTSSGQAAGTVGGAAK
jgi:membrane fusion protein, multidrug efflux system